MAIIYDKPILQPASGHDRLLILDPREGLCYPSPYDDWNILHVGFLLSATDGTNPNADLDRGHNVTEDVQYSTARDKFYIGAKVNSAAMPAEGEEPFVGIFPSGNIGSYATARSVYNAGSQPNFAFEDSGMTNVAVGVVHANATFEYGALGKPMYFPAPEYMVSSTTDRYCMFHALKLTISNKGQFNQQINVRHATNALGQNADGTLKKTDAQLRTLMLTTSYQDIGTFNWNLAGTPYALPNSIFAYFPFPNTRLRIHHVGIIRQS